MIYFLRFTSGAIKIGFTSNIDQRFSQLRAEYDGAELLHTIDGDYQTEQELHERFAHLRLDSTEQFQPGPDLLAFIGLPHLVTANPETIEIQPTNPRRRKIFHLSLSPECAELLREMCDRPISPISRSALIEHLIMEHAGQTATK